MNRLGSLYFVARCNASLYTYTVEEIELRSALRREILFIIIFCSIFTLDLSVHAAESTLSEQTKKTKPFIRGFAIGQYSNISAKELETKLKQLVQLGVNYVSLVISWSTANTLSTTIAPLPDSTTPDQVLRRMVNQAHEYGLKVFIFPILDVQQRKLQEWRGTLRPTDWNAWWKSYEHFIIHYARLAAESKAELFCIGSELVSTESMRDRWQRLIAKARNIYQGAIIYSANWDHYEPVKFWDLVDMVGLTGYYSLARTPNAPESEMLASWILIRNKLVSWSKKIRRPILFTEVGYPNLQGCAVSPWDYTQHNPPCPEEQRRAYAAFIKAWKNIPQLSGVFFWDWYGNGKQDEKLYSPQGKPAEKLVQKWFLSFPLDKR